MRAAAPRGPRLAQLSTRPQVPPRQFEPPAFPEACEIALKSISNYVTGNVDPKFKRTKSVELQAKLDTDLFGLSADSRQSFWTQMQRFKLLDLICKFYMTLPAKNESQKRYEYFTLIFCGREGSGPAHDHRMTLLRNLCCLAVQYPCYSLFDDIATWFMKIQSNVYAKRIVNELIEDFVLAPEEYNLCKDLLPLRHNAFEFSCFFIVFSIAEKNLCPQLIDLLGSWFNENPSEVLSFIAENQTLRHQFKDECIKPMLVYDVKKSLNDDFHDKFHCALTNIWLQWKTATHKVRNEIDAGHLKMADVLDELISNSDSLYEFQRHRLVENIRNCYSSNFYHASNFKKAISNHENCLLVRSGVLNDLIGR